MSKSPESYIEFLEIPSNPPKKTKVVQVIAKREWRSLGYIKWFGAWRRYCFYPLGNAIFEGKCLADVIKKLREMDVEHKEKTRKLKDVLNAANN